MRLRGQEPIIRNFLTVENQNELKNNYIFRKICIYFRTFPWQWFNRCWLKFPDVLNALLQIGHWKFLSSKWCIVCRFSSWFLLNAFPHCLHSNFLMLVWIILCRIKCIRILKDFSQMSHLKFFTSLWISKCWCISEFLVKLFPHFSHWYFFNSSSSDWPASVWVFRCSFNSFWSLKFALQ
jgi:hypothetical protein